MGKLWVSFSDVQSLLLVFLRNIGSFPVHMSELLKFEPLKSSHIVCHYDFKFASLFTKKKKGRSGCIEILLAPGNYPQVLVLPC